MKGKEPWQQGMPMPEPETDEEFRFIRGLPYYAPRLSKQIAFCLDNGSSKATIKKSFEKCSDPGIVNQLDAFIDFYIAEPERAKELFEPYQNTDYSMSSQ